ncbi:unnamed protein product [Schistosoma turkestanicum]|nr:unnamed protein product [Schistosoma turkestanicum]
MQTSLLEKASDQFHLVLRLLNLGENNLKEADESIISQNPNSTHTPRKTLKFVIPPHPVEKTPLSHSTKHCGNLSPHPTEDKVISKANVPNSTSHQTPESDDQDGFLKEDKDFDENPSNLGSTDDEVSSLILDVNNSTPQSTPCEPTVCDSFDSRKKETEDIYGFIFTEDKEIDLQGKTTPQQQTNSELKHTRSILKSRSLSPKTYFDSTCESSQDKIYYTVHGTRDSVDLTTVRFQIGCISPSFSGDSNSNDLVMNTYPILSESETIESPRTTRKTVRFADETNDFTQIHPTSMAPLFSNVFPLRIYRDADDVTSIFDSDTPSSIEESSTKIPEIKSFYNYDPTTSVSSNFLSISIGKMSNQLSKPGDRNSTNIYNTQKSHYLKNDDSTNWEIVSKNEYISENFNEQKDEYSTLDYELLKSSGKLNVTSNNETHSTTPTNSSRINTSQGYADLLIGRPNLHDDFLIPRQQLLTNEVSLFTHPFNGYKNEHSTTLSPQNIYRSNAQSNNYKIFLSGRQNYSLSDKTDTSETNRTQFLMQNLSSTGTPNNEQTYVTVRQSDTANKANILLHQYPTDSNHINEGSQTQNQDTYAPDYEGIDLSFMRRKITTTASSPLPSSIRATVMGTGHHRDHFSDTENCNKLVLQPPSPDITKESLSNKKNNNRNSESSRSIINIQQKQASQSSTTVQTTSARLLKRRPRVCEPSAVDLNISDSRMITSAYEFESTQSEGNLKENLLKFEEPFIIPHSNPNQNVSSNPKACWFRLHDGYSAEANYDSGEHPQHDQFKINIRNQPAVFKRPDKVANECDSCDYDNISNLPSKCVLPSTFRLGNTSVVKKLFGPKSQYATYTQGVSGLFQSKEKCLPQQPTKSLTPSQQLHQQENKPKSLSTLQPVPVEQKVFHQSSGNTKSLSTRRSSQWTCL